MNWRCEQKPHLTFITAPRRKFKEFMIEKRDLRVWYLDKVRKLRASLFPYKQRLLKLKREKQVYASDKKRLLFLAPLYDLDSVVDSARLRKLYNIIVWSADDISMPLNVNDSSGAASYPGCRLKFEARDFNENLFFDNLNYKKMVIPMIRQFYERKLPDIFRYWKQAEALHKNYKIDMLLWGNSPHRYPSGIVKEFFRLNRIPVCGMQYGGMSGSCNLAENIFETNLNFCDYYLSYGFQNNDIEDIPGGMTRSKPCIISVGSTAINRFFIVYKKPLNGKSKKRVDILFPASVIQNDLFYANEIINYRLFAIQKRIIDLMEKYKKKIIIKFPVGSYANNPLGIYIRRTYPGKFIIIDHMSLTETLIKYKVDTVVLEERSTPLNEVVVTGSNIILYDNPDWYGLTNQAYQMLSKRAVVCNDEESFLKKLKQCLDGNIEKKDTDNREFIKRYCTYKGEPVSNIENAIISLIDDKKKLII